MHIELAKRMDAFGESVFSELAQIKNPKCSQGIDMIDLSIGSPDVPTPSFVSEVISESAKNTLAYGYSLTGTQLFHEAVADFCERTYSAKIDASNEVTLLMGSQDGLVHLPMIFCNPGDIILAPDPGYTAYATGIAMAGANFYPLTLKKENDFLPDLKAIPEKVADQAKLMILNFPGNPVPAIASKEFFEDVIAFAKRYNIIVVHDFAYSELYYEEKPTSFLSVQGAKEVGIEMNSLSKSFNMAGCRIAYAVGNKQIIEALVRLKSNLDYGVFLPIQEGAIRALRDESTFLEENRKMYRERRDLLIQGFHDLGWKVETPKASMFIWAQVPEGYTSREFALQLIEKAHVVVTPGNAFGHSGEGYVRIALVQSVERLKEVVSRLKKSGIFNNLHTLVD